VIRECADLVRQINAQLVDQELPAAVLPDLQTLLTSARDTARFGGSGYAPDQMPGSETHPWTGPSNAVAPPMRLHLEDDVLVGLVECSQVYGLSQRVHGGVIAGLFDTMVATRGAFSGAPTTAKLVIDFRRPVPLNRTLRLEASVDRIEGRKCHVSAEMRDKDILLAEAYALMLAPRS
jgi:acyl-coenzyme A thioesterase PaaI-like protein